MVLAEFEGLSIIVKILVVEDEKRMAQVLRQGLQEQCHSVFVAGDGCEALHLARREGCFELILLDVMLPGLNGIEVARRLRDGGQRIPVLMLTARDTVNDVVAGLNAGADDYLTKPLSLAVLFARIRALERRAAARPRPVLSVGDLSLDVEERRALRGQREIQLTPKEFRLLEFLMRNQGRIASRQAIIDRVWGSPGENAEENTLDALMRLLRRKIDEPQEPELIQTMRGVGYYIEAAPRC